MYTRIDRKDMFYGAKSSTFETARILRENMTLPELILWKKLKDRQQFRFKFRRQHPVSFFIVDFYCHECKLAIEIDGEIHNIGENVEKDQGRLAELNRLGINVLRFTNEQVIHKLDFVLSNIKNYLESSINNKHQ
jgi:very-short-patch-repair endonuclease